MPACAVAGVGSIELDNNQIPKQDNSKSPISEPMNQEAAVLPLLAPNLNIHGHCVNSFLASLNAQVNSQVNG